jgi:hypothetical protein
MSPDNLGFPRIDDKMSVQAGQVQLPSRQSRGEDRASVVQPKDQAIAMSW